jgi:hypothetical protein
MLHYMLVRCLQELQRILRRHTELSHMREYLLALAPCLINSLQVNMLPHWFTGV